MAVRVSLVRKDCVEKSVQTDVVVQTTSCFHNEIFIYSICAGAFAFVILLCTVCQRRYKQIYNYFRRNTSDNGIITNVQENILEDVPSVEIEGIYEVIDESNMIDNFGNTENLDVHATKDETECPLDSNSYPNRYRPVKKDPNINNSNRSKSILF
ncbi:unnamed protein product [Mytilus coruscus]|uniref:Uncharacterized protein n=1 Tax=Mytilus coruscus TaxID=42192 RepID=A0A6J8DRZ8_MYTCO|nr:unnamed protein product [Mytilus coruscus]